MILMAVLQRLFGWVSIAILAVGAYLVRTWWEMEQALRDLPPGAAVQPAAVPDGRLYLGLLLLAFSFAGFMPLRLLLARRGGDARRLERGEGESVTAPDGAELRVERFGRADGPTLVLTHGWGMDSTMWWDARREL